MAFGAFIQGKGLDAGTVNSTTLAYTTNNVAGNILSLFAFCGLPAINNVTSVTDTAGNTWTRRSAIKILTDGDDFEAWTAFNSIVGANTVKVGNASSATLRLIIQEHTGNAASTTFDTSAASTATAISSNSGPATVAQATTLLLGGMGNASAATVTSTSPFTQRVATPASPNTRIAAQDALTTSTGSYRSIAFQNASIEWGDIMIAINAGSAAAPNRIRFPTPLSGVGSGNQFFGDRLLREYVLP